MNKYKSLFLFNRKQQRGIFLLLILLVVLVGFRFYRTTQEYPSLELGDVSQYQNKIDSIKAATAQRKDTIYLFNPNYITDYRAYILGLNEAELDRLSRFRESGKFINTAAQFQQVTEVSDQWLDSISPYFKFPSWVNQPKRSYSSSYGNRAIVASNINSATQDQLRAVYGIGPALSGRIIEQRKKLNGFIDIKQVRDVYGLSDSTMMELRKHFYVTPDPSFRKISLNKASWDELSAIPYFNDYLVDKLVEQRTLRDGFKSWDEVMLTSRFPQEKLALIQLYLTLE
ncbi:DNA uptake protein ComE [Nonlabens sp. Hel1_33_55]|uniref:ComEA family DNA-binding protein n=1 Tax=Nonlabens sp. Hel1_33_55 TaxID=1336802 RepID=UPI000875CB1D|nr:helix-hairpin-helix domain-containing protein [Nonlabens sp. Hel1_33_55]SCY45104.1 DNA uptake protein ComE [Nonlabens sp. Hel1_33_55]